MGGTLVVAGLWVRPLAESARRAGWRVIALDLFGDADTRRASAQWWPIGDAATLAIEPGLLVEALHRAAREPGALGWVAGSGFEGKHDLLDLRIPGLPLLGMPGAAVRRVRDPACFFGMLDRLALAHPVVSLHAPGDPAGWLAKDAGGSGGWHIRAGRAAAKCPGPTFYWQRLHAGETMSALFVGDSVHARVVALNRLLVRPVAGRPFVYHGAIGPIRQQALLHRVEEALERLVPALDLQGLASLDFLAQDDRLCVLEVNPRPSATMVLHDDAWPGGLVHAHLQGMRGRLPEQAAVHPAGVRGCLTVFADRPCHVDAALAADLARSPHCHDLPAPGSTFPAGAPVCSVSASAHSEDAVRAALDARAAGILARLHASEEVHA